MSKEYIKTLVRESLGGILKEKSKTPEKSDDKPKKKSADDRNLDQKDQVSIQNKLEAPMSSSYTDACKASGMITKHSELSNCIQKIKQKNDQGLTDDEKNDLTKALKDTDG